jgi:hypothetical protein
MGAAGEQQVPPFALLRVGMTKHLFEDRIDKGI